MLRFDPDPSRPRDQVRALYDEKRRLADELADPALGLDRRAVILQGLEEIGLDLFEVMRPEWA